VTDARRSSSKVRTAAAAVALGLGLLALVRPADAMMLAPPVMLVLALVWHASPPGEALITALRERRRPRGRARRRPDPGAHRPAQPEVVAPAGRLCVSALAMRPPPRALLVARCI
jgi:hypothetical protein